MTPSRVLAALVTVGVLAVGPTAPAGADARPLAGRVVVLDPGHNARNGGVAPSCNTSGTQTPGGYPEHRHTWDVVQRAATTLRALGARVVLTRPDDAGTGPCAADRGRLAGRVHADLLVSVHDDGAPANLRGCHVIWDGGPRFTAAQRAANLRLATALRDAVGRGTGLPRAPYAGRGSGLVMRTDLRTLEESTRPAALVEIGNMRNPRDAALLSSPAFRAREAAALVAGVRAYLRR